MKSIDLMRGDLGIYFFFYFKYIYTGYKHSVIQLFSHAALSHRLIQSGTWYSKVTKSLKDIHVKKWL